MYCDHCGAQQAPGARFCHRCGTPIGAELVAAPSAPPAVPAEGATPERAGDTIPSLIPPLFSPPLSQPLPPVRPSPTTGKRGLLALGGGALIGVVVLCVGLALLIVFFANKSGDSGTGLVPLGGGTGKIEFGTDFRESGGNFTIVGPKTTFTTADTMAFVAHTKETAGATSLDLLLTYVSPGGGESVVDRAPMNVADPKYSIFANRYAVATLMGAQQPGTYKLKLARGSTILAEGTFTYR